ncbi:hypothetical protein GJ496_000778 [Pomphorhynchus laevis]|nr:hypothetical protein GJ496_000778 [Pomphorhynchus laevis]
MAVNDEAMNVGLKSATVICQLLLQKSNCSKTKLIRKCLERRLLLWKERKLTDGASYEKLADSLYRTLLPSVLGQTTINDITRQLITLPLRHGGLGISDPSEKPENEYIRSMRMCEPLLAGISGNELRHQQYSLASLIRAEKDQFAHGKLANLTINKLEISESVALKSAIRNGLQYGECIQRLRTALSFKLAKMASTCIRAARTRNPEHRTVLM